MQISRTNITVCPGAAKDPVGKINRRRDLFSVSETTVTLNGANVASLIF